MDDGSTQRPFEVLVTGATGAVGRALVDRLLQAGRPPRALVRRPEAAAALRERGVRVTLGTLDDPQAATRALEGCEQLALVVPSAADQLQMETTMIDAAAAAGVSHVVKVSAIDANPSSSIPWARDLARGDAHLRRSGMRWTRLQPGAFMRNLLGDAWSVRRGFLTQTSGHGAAAWVDADDVAAATHRVLLDPALHGGSGECGRSIRLTSGPATSYFQVAQLMSQELHRRIRFVSLPAPAMYAVLRARGNPPWRARGLLAQSLVIRRGDDDVRTTSGALADLIDQAPVDLAGFIRANRSTFQLHETTSNPSQEAAR